MHRAQEVWDHRSQPESVEKYWIECIRKWYPDLHLRTYFFPPLHVNRVPYEKQKVAGEVVLVRQNISDSSDSTAPMTCWSESQETGAECLINKLKDMKIDADFNLSVDQPAHSMWTYTDRSVSKPVVYSDIRGDSALDCILTSLRKMADDCEPKEVMMIISQLPIGQFFRKNSVAILPSLSSKFEKMPQKYRQGDLDILIILNKCGLITGEIKSVGMSLCQQQDDTFKNCVKKKVREAIKQLEKADVVLKLLISDLPGVSITHTLMLPSVTSHELQRIIDDDIELATELQRCLSVSNTSEAKERILCKDHVSEPVEKNMRKWFNQFLAVSSQPSLSNDTFERLVARFCGPEITLHIHSVTNEYLEARTESESISETGNIFTQLILTPQQINILRMSPPRIFLGGPPGTGKTIVLALQGLIWLRLGNDVHLVSTWRKSRVSAIMIEYQLKERCRMMFPQLSARVHLHIYDFERPEDIDIAVFDLVQAVNSKGQIFVLAETAGPVGSVLSFEIFCNKLIASVSEVYIWAASAYKQVRPMCLDEYTMHESLRIPAAVKTEVVKAEEIQDGSVASYKPDMTVSETHGPLIKILKHTMGMFGHSEDKFPENCMQCGHEVAFMLQELNVGAVGASLQFHDVMILCNEPRDDQMDESGVVVSRANGLVQGLRAKDIPLCVQTPAQQQSLTQGNIDCETGQNIRNLVLGLTNKVMVTHSDCVWGLKRKVVVIANYGLGHDALIGPARCSSQLVVIHSIQDTVLPKKQCCYATKSSF